MIESIKCRELKTHNITGLKDTDKCKWCGKTVKEIKNFSR